MTNQQGDLVRLVCASANRHKVQEMAEVLAGLVIMEPRPEGIPDVIEDASTLIGNARLKARAVMTAPENVHHLPAVADDTGLFVAALPEELGVHTARYARGDHQYDHDPDRANRRKLLQALDDRGCRRPEERRATFVTVALISFPDGTEIVAEGRCNGHIAASVRGSRGFGFDPLFIPDDIEDRLGARTFAEMSDAEKNELSHRGRAFRDLARQLVSIKTSAIKNR